MEAVGILIMLVVVVLFVVVPIVMLSSLSALKNRVELLWREQQLINRNLIKLKERIEGSGEEVQTDGPVSGAAGQAVEPQRLHPAYRPKDLSGSQSEEIGKPSKPPAVKPAPPPAPGAEQRTEARPVAEPASTMPAPGTSAPRTKPEPARSPSRIGKAVSDIIQEGWNWLLVNEKYRPEGVTAEYAVATTWMTRLGIIVLVLGIAYGLKYSMDHGWMGPEARTALALLAGIAMLVGGLALCRKKAYFLLGQGFMGGGIVTLYFSAFAASPMYHLVPLPVAYGLMILVTVTAGILAVRSNSMLVAMLGLVGGYMTPVLLSTGDGNLGVLYTYLLILSLGVLGVALYKRWRMINFLALIFTYILVGVSLAEYYEDNLFVLCMVLISALFVVHSLVIIIQSLVRGRHSTVLEVIHLVLNSLAFGVTGYSLIEATYGRPYPSVLTVLLAAFYVGHVVVFLRRKLLDRPLLTCLLALAGLYTVITLPIVFEQESLTISFALLAFMFLWLGRRMESHFVENMAHGLYLFVFIRLVALDTGRNYSIHPSSQLPMAEYWKAMAGRLWTFGVSIGSILGAFFLQRYWQRPGQAAHVEKSNNTPEFVPDTTAQQVLYWAAVVGIFGFLYLELNTMFSYMDPLRLPILTVLCVAMGFYFLWRLTLSCTLRVGMLIAMIAFTAMALAKLLFFDLFSWDLCGGLYYDMEYSVMDAGLRLMDFGAVLVLVAAAWALLLRTDDRRPLAPFFGYGGLLLLLIYMSLELNSFLYWKLPDFREGGISVLWALTAMAYIAGGVWRNIKPLRYAGLILFAIVLGKVFLYDLQDMAVIYRVVAFMIVGVALLLGSFAYMRANTKFKHEENES